MPVATMPAATAELVTFAELEQLPDVPGYRYELHHGELVQVAPPKHRHIEAQDSLGDLLKRIAGRQGKVVVECGFRAHPDHEYRVADVAFIARERWKAIPKDGNLQGAPDLVVEVLSPSNTAWEIFDKEHLCLDNGAREFWVVDPVRQNVRVSGIEGPTRTYSHGQSIPVFFGGTIDVDSIFAEFE